LPILSALWVTPKEDRPVGGVSRQDQTTNWDGFFGENRADLSPQFVAALMGVPQDWLTHSTSEATDWSPPQQQKPSSSFSTGQTSDHHE